MIKRWTQEEENLLIKLKKLGYTYKQISIEIGRSATSCFNKYKRLTDPKYIEKDKQYYEDNRYEILERQKQYYEDNRYEILEQQKQYREDNRDRYLEYQKQYREDNRDELLKYQKQYREDNREYFKQYRRHYFAQNPDKHTRKERYDGEFADIQLCHKFYNGISPITGTKNDLQVHHLINIRDNQEFWESATDEEKINYLILIPKDLHIAYHSWLGGTKIPSTPESFWEFINTIYFNEQTNLDLFTK